MAAVMADLDVVLLTSRNEGSPVALIEAAAAGLPVVATDVGGVRSVVRDGETGLLVPSGDPDAAAAALRELLGDPDKMQAMGRAGRSHVLSAFDKSRLLRDISRLYSDLV
jgi:glycosyltransferase involved in cell wall biosynthesis